MLWVHFTNEFPLEVVHGEVLVRGAGDARATVRVMAEPRLEVGDALEELEEELGQGVLGHFFFPLVVRSRYSASAAPFRAL